MVQRHALVENRSGLHARPAALFVKAASEFSSAIRVAKAGREVNAKSLLGLLSLGVQKGTAVTIIAEGPDEVAAVEKLSGLVIAGLGE